MNLKLVSRILVTMGACLAISAEADVASLFTNLNGPRPTAGKPRRASILVIQCDGLGYLDLSCYGQQKFKTPNLDRLAAEGMQFTNYDAGGMEAPADRAALLLGRDPGPAATVLPASALTVAQVLKTEGYWTCLMGEWDFGGQGSGNAPWAKGFAEFAGYFTPEDAENYYSEFIYRCAPQAVYNTNNGHFDTYIGPETLLANTGNGKGIYLPDLYTKSAMNYMRDHLPDAANHFRPFFLWLNYPTPRPNLALAKATGNGLQVPTDAPYSDQAWPQAQKNEAAMIARLDGNIGQLLEFLNSRHMTNNMAIFFTSTSVPQKLGGIDPMFFPSVVSTNDVRLPMIARWPGHIPAGQVSGYHWTPANFLPTAAELAMADYPTNEVGTSILPVLYGEAMTNAPGR